MVTVPAKAKALAKVRRKIMAKGTITLGLAAPNRTAE
jgi:hypothetical protein